MRHSFCRLGTLFLIGSLWFGGDLAQASAQQGLTGTVWIGEENLGGFGPLSFTFYTDGRVKMVDARSTVHGNWTQNGTSIFITFANCEYRGTINGSTIRGVAFFTSGPIRTQWAFVVQKL